MIKNEERPVEIIRTARLDIIVCDMCKKERIVTPLNYILNQKLIKDQSIEEWFRITKTNYNIDKNDSDRWDFCTISCMIEYMVQT